ncbi:glutathione S-transferase N-terminal domain-containing protein [Variovorax paradoxus]|nr:glutathione S-transferase N-terminal domain-containing protein [Variovorax paradoxus]
MKLYFLPGAPSPMRVRLYVAEKNADSTVLEIQEVNLQGGLQREAAHLRRNPFGKVPVLEVDESTLAASTLKCNTSSPKAMLNKPSIPATPTTLPISAHALPGFRSGLSPLGSPSASSAHAARRAGALMP